MLISSIQSYNYKFTNFKSKYVDNDDDKELELLANEILYDNKTAPEYKIDPNIFFINMSTYAKKQRWAKQMAESTYKISSMIQEKENFNNVIDAIEQGVKSAYYEEGALLHMVGIHRKNKTNPFEIESYYKSRGNEYFDRINEKYEGSTQRYGWSPKANEEYKDACTSGFYKSDSDCYTVYEGWSYDSNNLELAKKEYEKLLSIENPTLDEINKSVATINWLICQESPWQRGTDSIVNMLTKAIYHAYNIELSPIKQGYSFDFEAWCSDLDEYIKNYPNLFEIPPHKYEE